MLKQPRVLAARIDTEQCLSGMKEGATTVLFRSSHIQVHILYRSQSVETVDRSKLTMLAPTENNLSSKRQLIWPFDASYILQQVLMSVSPITF